MSKRTKFTVPKGGARSRPAWQPRIEKTYKEETFDNTTVRLDGNAFIGCTFEHCAIEYWGENTFSMESCRFSTDCYWVVGGAAGGTLKALAALYRIGGPFREMIEKTFDQIRTGDMQRDPRETSSGFDA